MLLPFALLIGIYFLVFISLILFFDKFTHKLDSIPKTAFLLVLGAGVNKAGKPSKILEDRLISTLRIAQTFQPNTIILSGTKRGKTYDETLSMQNYLVEKGIEKKYIHLDPTGFSTFQSCKNFKNDFGRQEVVIISQRFHLYRSIMLSRIIGLHSYGLAADNHHYKIYKICVWYLREFAVIPYNILKLLWYFMQNFAFKIFSQI